MVNVGKLLSYLDLHVHLTRASPCVEPMEDIVTLDAGPEAGIDDGLHNHPEHLQEANPPGVCVSLRDKYQDVQPQLPWYLPGAPHILDYAHELHPPSRFGGVFPPSPG